MHLGIFAKTFERGSVGEVFSAVAAAGYTGVQFNLTCVGLPMLPVEPVPDSVLHDIEHAAATHRISIPAISGTFNMIHPDRAVVEAGLRGLQLLADVCRRLHIPVITVCTGTRDRESMWREHPENSSPGAWSDLVAAMIKAIEITAGGNLSLAIEPEPANVVHSATLAKRLLAEVGSPRLGVTLDAANLIKGQSAGEDNATFAEAFELLGDRVVLAHAKDKMPDGKVCPAGEGVVDFTYFVRGLRALNFTGFLVAHGFEEKDARSVADYLNQQL